MITNFIKDNGIIFIKFAQIITSREDMKKEIDENLKDEIKKLQDECFFEETNIIYKNINYVSKKPIAAGSIANVYLIKLHQEIKILKSTHPSFKKKLVESCENLKVFLKLLKIFTKYDFVNFINIDNYYTYLLNQSLLSNEANNQMIFYNIFKDKENFKIPNVFAFNNDSIIMEYTPGLKLDEFRFKYPNFEYEAIALIYCSIIHMARNKIIHGDFHYGNFLFNLKINQPILIILDFGIICKLNSEQSEFLINVLNPKSKQEKRDSNLNKFIISYDKNIDYDKIINRDSSDILKFLSDNKIVIPNEVISFISTLQTLFCHVKQIKRKDKLFDKFLSGYILENDYF